MSDATKLIAAIRKRFKYRVARRMYSVGNVPNGRSYDEVYAKLEEDEGLLSAVKVAPLRSALIEALLVNDKLVYCYDIDENHLKSAHKAMEVAMNGSPASHSKTTFPLSVSESELKKIPLNEPEAVSLLELDGVTAVLFSTVRLIEKREGIDVKQLSPVISAQYDSVVGLKKSLVQCVNAILIPYSGSRCYILTDNHDAVTPSSAALDQITMRNVINKLIGATFLPSPTNLFSAIRNLYLNTAEGDVALLSHAVPNGIKHERMKRGKCVRKERFHKGGLEAVDGDITPYQIALRWTIDGDHGTARPELRLLGNFRTIYDIVPSLSEADIENCATFNELHFVLDRLQKHV